MSDDLAVEADASSPDASGDDSFGSFMRELPILLLIAFGLAFLLRMFVIQVFYIPSGSMIPTLEINDRIVVEKVTYLFREPTHGEIIVFAGDDSSTQRAESGTQKVVRGVGQFLGVVPMDARDFVKRVIGLPGDHVIIEGGIVSVNGVELDEPYVNRDGYDGEFDVPDGQLFVLGDNRGSSSDSRFPSLGYIDASDVVGRAVLIIWPFEHLGTPARADYAPIPASPPSAVATTPWHVAA